MIKKILLTLLVIITAWVFIRWRQRKTAEVARHQPPPQPQTGKRVGIYYLAGSVLTLMLVSVVLWVYFYWIE